MYRRSFSTKLSSIYFYQKQTIFVRNKSNWTYIRSSEVAFSNISTTEPKQKNPYAAVVTWTWQCHRFPPFPVTANLYKSANFPKGYSSMEMSFFWHMCAKLKSCSCRHFDEFFFYTWKWYGTYLHRFSVEYIFLNIPFLLHLFINTVWFWDNLIIIF